MLCIAGCDCTGKVTVALLVRSYRKEAICGMLPEVRNQLSQTGGAEPANSTSERMPIAAS